MRGTMRDGVHNCELKDCTFPFNAFSSKKNFEKHMQR